MCIQSQKYDSNSGAVWAGLRDLNDRKDLPYDELRSEDRLDGRTVLITGATSGLGFAVAKDLAARGARLFLVSRREAAKELEAVRSACQGVGASVEMLRADMRDFSSIRTLAANLADAGERIDVIISNAAVVPSSARETIDGYEEMLQVNALSPALLLTELLNNGVIPNNTYAGNGLDSNKEPLPRIVVTASEAHRTASNLKLDTLNNIEPYRMAESTARYGWTKLLLLSFTRELARRLSVDCVDVSVHALCPGPIASNIAREAPAIARPLLNLFFRFLFQSPETAASPVVYLTASNRIEGQTGLYQFLMRKRQPSNLAEDTHSGTTVWNAFEEIFLELLKIDPA